MHISDDTLPQSTERTLMISGQPPSVHKIVYDIACKLLEVRHTHIHTPTHTHTHGVGGWGDAG
jgi:hypothetical protein